MKALPILLLVLSLAQAQGQAVLNEVMVANVQAVPGFGGYPDWVELYNPSAGSVSLVGMSLTDDPAQPRRFAFPAGASLGPLQFLVVWCDGLTNAAGWHAPFSLKTVGGEVSLFATDGVTLMDRVAYGVQLPDLTVGRVPNGSGAWALTRPTSGAANLSAPTDPPSTLRINEWLASESVGSDWIEMYNPANRPVDLGGLVLSDMAGAPTNRAVPALSFVAGNGYLQFLADDLASAAANHLDFKLSKGGDTITLFGPDRQTVLDRVAYTNLARDYSQGRFPDGSAKIVTFQPDQVTPGASNFRFLEITNVVVNEVLAHTDPPLEDAIELHNPTSDAVDIGYWWLSNRRETLEKYRIPGGTVIPAGGYMVFYEYQFDPDFTGNSPSFRFNSAHGDEVYLTTANAAGELTGYRTGVSFGATANGVSVGRVETSTGAQFVPLAARSFGADNPRSLAEFRTGRGAPNAAPAVGPVVIQEIMYRPPNWVQDTNTADNTLDEYVALYNLGPVSVPLYDPAAATNSWQIQGAIGFTFPPGAALPPGSFALVVSFDPALDAAQLERFRDLYAVPSSTPIVGPYRGKLSNSGESLELYRPDSPQLPPHPDAGFVPYLLVDRVQYSSRPPWPAAADGGGSALVRPQPEAFGNDPLSWTAAAPSPGRPAVKLEAVRTVEGKFVVRFFAMAGASYSLESNRSLAAAGWQTVGSWGGERTSHTVELSFPLNGGSGDLFYRVKVNGP